MRRQEAATAPYRFRSKPKVPSLVGHLLRVSYVCFVGQSPGGQSNRFPDICLTTEENPGKPQLRNRRGHLVALAKPIGLSQKDMLKNFRSGIRRSRDLGSAPPGHSSKIHLFSIRIRIEEANRRRSLKCEAQVTTSSMLFLFLRTRRIAEKKTVVLLT